MIRIERTALFAEWLRSLTDLKGKAAIVDRIARAANGNFGDIKVLGDGLSEMRIDHGPGYRVYFARVGTVVYILLAGGTKRTQPKDIKRAKEMAASLKE